MKTEIETNTNIKEFPSRIALAGEVYTIDFESIMKTKYSDSTAKVTHLFLPYISENGERMYFDKNSVGHKSPGLIVDGRTKHGKKMKKILEQRDIEYENKVYAGEAI